MFEENCLQHILMCFKQKKINHAKEMLFTPHVTIP